jgi:hypothetical protein
VAGATPQAPGPDLSDALRVRRRALCDVRADEARFSSVLHGIRLYPDPPTGSLNTWRAGPWPGVLGSGCRRDLGPLRAGRAARACARAVPKSPRRWFGGQWLGRLPIAVAPLLGRSQPAADADLPVGDIARTLIAGGRHPRPLLNRHHRDRSKPLDADLYIPDSRGYKPRVAGPSPALFYRRAINQQLDRVETHPSLHRSRISSSAEKSKEV